jgi:hypothetical protein
MNTELDALKTNLDNFFLIVKRIPHHLDAGPVIQSLQSLYHLHLNFLLGWLWIPGGWIS